MHPSRVSVLVGVAVWMLGLTAAILTKRHLDSTGKTRHSWIPVTAFLALSAASLVIAGLWYQTHAPSLKTVMSEQSRSYPPTAGGPAAAPPAPEDDLGLGSSPIESSDFSRM